MKRFRSSYQSLLNVRQQQKDLAEMEVLARRRDLDNAESAAQNALEQTQAAENELTLAWSLGLTASQLLTFQEYVSNARHTLDKAHQEVARARDELESATVAMRQARLDERTVAELIERQKHEHRRNAQREAQLALDDASLSNRQLIMVKALAIIGFAIVVFGAAAGGAWYLRMTQTAAKPDTAADSDPDPSPTESISESAPTGPAKAVAGEEKVNEPLPVAVRPRPMSVEEILRYGMGLKARDETIRKREEALRQQEARMKLVFADIAGEQKEIDGLRTQVASELKEARNLVAQAEQVHKQIAIERQNAATEIEQYQSTQIEIDASQRENVKRLSDILQGMEPEKAADVVKEMSNDGNLEMAVQILSNFEERDAAKLLTALDDPKLIQQLIDEFKKIKRPAKTKA
ncbi:Uncharacterized protein SCF082_LOCUS2845, partial [Durusdinium trenchii]